MARFPTDEYSPVNSVSPDVSGSGNYQNVRADPSAFGADIDKSIGNLGEVTQDLGKKAFSVANELNEKEKPYRYDKTAQALLEQSATEAKVNDTIANKWAPVTSQLRSGFDQAQGADKLVAYNGYIGGLHNARADLLQNASTDYEKNILGGYTSQYIDQETKSAQRMADQAFTQFSDQANQQKLMVDANNAINNYNNPDVVNSTVEMMDAQIQKHGMDRGWSPEQTEQYQRSQSGYVYGGMVNRAIDNGDTETASKIYANNKYLIPGPEQLVIEQKLHSVSMVQYGRQASEALVLGGPVPAPTGGPAVLQVKAAVANDAQARGIDPNIALTVSRIESFHGQNVGIRGDIGQTGKGGDLSTQIANMNTEIQRSAKIASNALGRAAEPWEMYVVYQQGASGGPALFKAAQATPTARAVDVLSQYYKNPKDALAAIQNNGGNANMTAGQFLDFWKQNYEACAKRENCDVPENSSLGNAMIAPTKEQGIPMQPSATPIQALSSFNNSFQDAIVRANQIPNLEERAGVMKALQQKQGVYEASASAYKQQFQIKAQTLASNPNFTDISQIPPDMYVALGDNPLALEFMEKRADYNLKHPEHMVSYERTELGPQIFDYMSRVYAPPGTPDAITDSAELYGAMNKGEITPAGFDKLSNELKEKNTPEGQGVMSMKQKLYNTAKGALSGSNSATGAVDVKGDKLFRQWTALAMSLYDQGIASGKNPQELLSPDSSDYLGNTLAGFQRSMNQQVQDMMKDAQVYGSNEIGNMKPDELKKAYQDAKKSGDTRQMQRLEEKAVELGYARKAVKAPQVPTGE